MRFGFAYAAPFGRHTASRLRLFRPFRGSIRLRKRLLPFGQCGAFAALWRPTGRHTRFGFAYAALLGRHTASRLRLFRPFRGSIRLRKRLLPFGQCGAFFYDIGCGVLGLPAIFFRQFIGQIRIAHAMQIRYAFSDELINFGSIKKAQCRIERNVLLLGKARNDSAVFFLKQNRVCIHAASLPAKCSNESAAFD